MTKGVKLAYKKKSIGRAPYGSKTSGDLTKGIKSKIRDLKKDMREWTKILKSYQEVQKRLKV